jgi:hypothetical protein
MTQQVWYVGTDDVRTILDTDWDALGITQGTTVWNSGVSWGLPITMFSDDALLWLVTQSEFAIGASDPVLATRGHWVPGEYDNWPIVVTDEVQFAKGQDNWLLLSLAGPNGIEEDLTAYATAFVAKARPSADDSRSISFATSLVDSNTKLKLLISEANMEDLIEGERVYGFDVQGTGGAESPLMMWSGDNVITVIGQYSR